VVEETNTVGAVELEVVGLEELQTVREAEVAAMEAVGAVVVMMVPIFM
jgi:hypothetical protein